MTAAPTARLFIAVDPPEEVRTALTGWTRSALRGSRAAPGSKAPLRVLDPDLLHLTLCFLGNRPTGEIDPLCGELAACTTESPPELSLGAPIWLPKRHPRVLAVELHDDEGRLATLRATVMRAIRQASTWHPDHEAHAGKHRTRFHPHITVARMRPDAAPRDRLLPPTPQLSFTPTELILYRSWLSPEGATYEPLATSQIA